MANRLRVGFVGVLCAGTALAAGADLFVHTGQRHVNPRTPQDSEFVFARIRYTPRAGSGSGGHGYGNFHGRVAWAHTYPQAEQHLLRIAAEVTGVRLSGASHIIIPLDSNDLFKFPFAYITEPGEMQLTEAEAANLREYLARGGFVIVDDFATPEAFERFKVKMRAALPGWTVAPLPESHPVFRAFYTASPGELAPPYLHSGGGRPRFYGYFDASGRLGMVVNHDNNLGAYWVWADDPHRPLSDTAEGVRLGVNYMVYALTH